MKNNNSDWSLRESKDGFEEMLILCRLFGDMITPRLCDLRRRELSGAWDASCPVCESLSKANPRMRGTDKSLKSGRKIKKQGTDSRDI